jgi:hypothetical protein
MLTKRQNIIVAKFVVVIGFTAFAVFAMFNIKDFINRRESMIAMTELGKYILEYKTKNHSLPPLSNIEDIQKNIEGSVRLGQVRYRSMEIDIDSPGDTILAYVPKHYHSLFLKSGYIVLRLNGKVEWMENNQFEELLASQKDPGKTASR